AEQRQRSRLSVQDSRGELSGWGSRRVGYEDRFRYRMQLGCVAVPLHGGRGLYFHPNGCPQNREVGGAAKVAATALRALVPVPWNEGAVRQQQEGSNRHYGDGSLE